MGTKTFGPMQPPRLIPGGADVPENEGRRYADGGSR